MKLDVSQLRYMSREEFRILTAIELGMKNHEFVPVQLIEALAKLTRGGTFKAITQVHKNKLVFHDRKKYDGYKLTYSGYDYLALKALCIRGSVVGVGNQIGVGKEADVFLAADEKDNELVIKLHRLGRISFRQIKNKRDYLLHRKSASWLYLSRLAALKEYAYMKALYDHGFPVPEPMDVSRHCIVMRRIKAYPLTQVSKLANPGKLFNTLMQLITKLAAYGLIHSDFNEFNLLVDDEQNVTMIDFPQMVSTSHYNAEMYFDRDVQCVVTYFKKRYNFHATNWPRFKDLKKEFDLDENLRASGFNSEVREEYEQLFTEYQKAYSEMQGQEVDGMPDESSEEEEEEEDEKEGDEDDGDGDVDANDDDDAEDDEDEDLDSEEQKPAAAAPTASGVVRIQLQKDVVTEPEIEALPANKSTNGSSIPTAAAVPAAAASAPPITPLESDENDATTEPAKKESKLDRKVISNKVRAKLQKRAAPPKNRNTNKQREKRRNQQLAELKDSRLTASQNRIVCSLTKKQVEEYREAFKVFDKDGDGQITPNEMEAALKAMGATPTQAEVRDIINEFDIDGNGHIDFNEFLVMMAMQHDTEDDYLAAFQAMDADNDGMITIAEMNKLLDGIGIHLTPDERKAVFGTFDVNGDGQVSFDEFATLMKRSSAAASKKKNTPYVPDAAK